MSMLSGATGAANLGKQETKEDSSSSSRSSSAGGMAQNLSQSQNHNNSLQQNSNNLNSVRAMGKSGGTTVGIKRKKPEPETYSNLPPRRSLRPRIERSYAESPDIVLEFEEEPVKVNGNVNGCAEEDEDTDSDPGEMPPSPPMKVMYYIVLHNTYSQKGIPLLNIY